MNAAFWDDLERDPAIQELASAEMPLRDIASHKSVLAFTSNNGAYLAFDMIYPTGRFWDLHAMFKPAGYGREALECARTMVSWLFHNGAAVLSVSHRPDRISGRPPRSFGFRDVSGAEPVKGKQHLVISSILTREMWYNSPAYKRIGTQCL